MSIKLPKQWRHWCQKAKLQPEGRKRGPQWCWFCLIGHGRRWRVNCYGEFEAGEHLTTFDRWANSARVSCPIPQTEEEFLSSVEWMLSEAHRKSF